MCRRISIGLVILLVLCVSAAGSGSAKPVVELLPAAEVSGPDILLADIAEFKDEATKAKFGSIYVGAAALPGSTRRLTLGQIEVRLRQAGVNPRDFQIVGAAEVWVTTGDKLPAQKAAVEAEDALAVNLFSDSSPSGTSALEVGNPSYGKTYIYQVVVPVRDIARHELINREDLRVEEREGRTIPSNLAAVEDLVGKRATRLLVAGSELTVYAAEVPPAVERGDLVTLVAAVGSVTVTAAGKVHQTGAVGDIIAVENIGTRTVVYGKVISSELVQVEIGGLR